MNIGVLEAFLKIKTSRVIPIHAKGIFTFRAFQVYMNTTKKYFRAAV